MSRAFWKRLTIVHACSIMPASLVVAQLGGHGIPQEPGDQGVPFRGGVEMTLGGQALHTYDRISGAGHMEFAFRGPGRTGDRRGPFSIGIAASFHPQVGRWEAVPTYIGHVRDFNLQAGNNPPRLTVGGVELRPKELFLATSIDPENVYLSGNISLSPGAQNVLVLDLYQLRNVRMDIWGLMVPMRWHFGTDKAHGARFFAEAGMGVDVLRVQATYDLDRTALTMNIGPQVITFTLTNQEMDNVEPLDGNMASNVVLTRAMVGGGMDLGRFRVFVRAQHTVSTALEQDGDRYRRVRGNVLALPVIAEAWNDREVSEALASGAVVPYGRTDIPRNADNGGGAQSSDRANGVDRFWDGTQAVLGIAFRLR